MKSKNPPPESIINGWKVGKFLGRGGNGEVRAAVKGGVSGALKRLHKRSGTSAVRLNRFCDELDAMRQCQDIKGVLPVLDFDVSPTGPGEPWFVMGLAQPLDKALGKKPSLTRVVEAVLSIANTLQQMHERDYSHRDIKPENLFYYEGGWAVGDFGLVSFKGKSSVTASGERIGPIYYIAPEMLNSAPGANGAAADVFSLAKTLWVLATGQRYPLPGSHDSAHEAFQIGTYINEVSTRELDKLIAHATLHSPIGRPTMAEIVAQLEAWLKPRSEPEHAMKFDVSKYAVDLEKRRNNQESQRERSQRFSVLSQEVGLRLREQLRPFANELERTLSDAKFEVDLNIDRYQYGFSIQAGVPEQTGYSYLNLNVGIGMAEPSTVNIGCQVQLDRRTDGGACLSIWQKKFSFLEGSPLEAENMEQLEAEIRRVMPDAVKLTLDTIFGSLVSASHDQYELSILDESQAPISEAHVAIIDDHGLVSHQTSDLNGRVFFKNLTGTKVDFFIAHERFVGKAVSTPKEVTIVKLEQLRGVGSMIATRDWKPIESLGGSLNFHHEPSGRKYVHGKNISIDGNSQTATMLTIGKGVELKGKKGGRLGMVPIAVRGPCFLLRIEAL